MIQTDNNINQSIQFIVEPYEIDDILSFSIIKLSNNEIETVGSLFKDTKVNLEKFFNICKNGNVIIMDNLEASFKLILKHSIKEGIYDKCFNNYMIKDYEEAYFLDMSLTSNINTKNKTIFTKSSEEFLTLDEKGKKEINCFLLYLDFIENKFLIEYFEPENLVSLYNILHIYLMNSKKEYLNIINEGVLNEKL